MLNPTQELKMPLTAGVTVTDDMDARCALWRFVGVITTTITSST